MSADRGAILRSHGATESEVSEMLSYSESGFDSAALSAVREYPLADEPFVAAWEGYAREAVRTDTVSTLRRHLVQLRFPVQAGTSTRDDYLAATRRGVLPPSSSEAAAFLDEDGISIVLHPTPAGRLPVVITNARADFETLIRALTRRNEPDTIPKSMGACIVGGYNNWSRVAEHRDAWSIQTGLGAAESELAWPNEFRRLAQSKDLYQDRFVILSNGPYSGTPASALGLCDDEWQRLSLTIRLEHECAHYFTRRVFGSMKNSLLDELIADYTGIVAARGRFEKEWLLRFMGVEEPHSWRPDGRLVNYRGTPPLSDGAFVVLQTLVRRAADTLDQFDALVREGAYVRDRSLDDTARAIAAIAGTGLERLTAPDAAQLLHEAYSASGDLAVMS